MSDSNPTPFTGAGTTDRTPRVCQVGYLTAMLQEPYGRQTFLENPRQAAMDALLKFHIPMAGRHDCHLELGGALSLIDGYIPPELMLDPVAYHVPVSTPTSGAGTDLSKDDAEAILAACETHGTKVRTIGVFENLLHDNPKTRAQVYQHVARQARAAKRLGADGVTLFIGRNPKVTEDENWLDFVKNVIPLLRYITEVIGIKVFLENCPMPGWNNLGLWTNNICNTPRNWFIIDCFLKAAGVKDVVLNYDVSHTILQGSDAAGTFHAINALGIGHMMTDGRIHGKDQHVDPVEHLMTEGRGATSLRGDYKGGVINPDKGELWKAWLEMRASHGFPMVKHHNPLAERRGWECDWLQHQYLLRKLFNIDPNNYMITLEHEWPALRLSVGDDDPADLVETKHKIMDELLALSANGFRAIDAAADVMFQSETAVANWADGLGETITLPNSADSSFDVHYPAFQKKADDLRGEVAKFPTAPAEPYNPAA